MGVRGAMGEVRNCVEFVAVGGGGDVGWFRC